MLSFLKVCLYGCYTNCQFYQISLFHQLNIVFFYKHTFRKDNNVLFMYFFFIDMRSFSSSTVHHDAPPCKRASCETTWSREKGVSGIKHFYWVQTSLNIMPPCTQDQDKNE